MALGLQLHWYFVVVAERCRPFRAVDVDILEVVVM